MVDYALMDSTFGERFRRLREGMGISGAAMAGILGVSKQTVYGVESGDRLFSQEILTALAERGVDVNSLLTGRSRPELLTQESMKSDSFFLARLEPHRAHAGPGPEDSNILEPGPPNIPYPIEWGRDLVAMKVTGDNMIEICLVGGDIVLYRPNEVEGNGIYVLGVNGEMLVRLVEFNHFERTIVIRCENSRYDARTESVDSQTVKFVGKVKGWLHHHPY